MRHLRYVPALAAALFAASPVLAQETIKIGLVQPLTGSVAYNGIADVNGSKLAVEERNKAGGVLGKKVELVIEDGQCKPANSINAAEKLIQKDKVVALSGAFCSSATAAIMPVAERYKMPLITGVSSKADLTEKGNKYFFRAAETDALLSRAFAKILADDLKLKNVAYVGVNDDWGRGGVEVAAVLGLGAAARPAVQEHDRLTVRIAAQFPIELMAVADIERARIIGFDFRIERPARRAEAVHQKLYSP